jgi:hypothetical protein
VPFTGTPNWALTVKTTVPSSCTHFPKFSAVGCPKGMRSTAREAIEVSTRGPCLWAVPLDTNPVTQEAPSWLLPPISKRPPEGGGTSANSS